MFSFVYLFTEVHICIFYSAQKKYIYLHTIYNRFITFHLNLNFIFLNSENPQQILPWSIITYIDHYHKNRLLSTFKFNANVSSLGIYIQTLEGIVSSTLTSFPLSCLCRWLPSASNFKATKTLMATNALPASSILYLIFYYITFPWLITFWLLSCWHNLISAIVPATLTRHPTPPQRFLLVLL